MPNHGTHLDAGVITGGGLAFCMSRGQTPRNQAIETAGGAVAGGFFGCLPDLLEPANHPRHRKLAHGALPAAGVGIPYACVLSSWQTSLRLEADRHAALREQASSDAAYLLHAFLEFLLRLLAGALPGALGGYSSHLVLDASTPQSLPSIK